MGAKRATESKRASAKKAKFIPQPVPEPESLSDNEATFYQSAEDMCEGSDSSDILNSSDDENDKGKQSDDLDDLEILDDKDLTKNDEDSDSEKKSVSKTKSDDPNKKTSAEQHLELKKLLAERKLKRKAGAQVEQIKALWEKLRVKKPAPPPEVKEKLCNDIWELSKDVIYDLVLKHDASRVVQTLVKHTTKERRDIIVKALQKNYYKLATSSYGKYLMVKLLHYGSKESRALIVNELHGKLRKLMRHKEGAYVIEDLYVLYSSAQQKQQMTREFWGSEYAIFKDSGKDKTVLDVVHESTEKRQIIMNNLNKTITASVEKGLTGFQVLHAAMREYVTILTSDIDKTDADIRIFIDLLAEQFPELVHTPEGSEVACSLISVANAKERKIIIRALKNHTKNLIENEFGNLVLTTLFMTVDDTVLLHKSFNVELVTGELLPEIIQGKFSRRPLLYLLKGLNGKYFAPKVKEELSRYEKLAHAKTTKKPQDQRRKELLAKVLPLIYKALLETTDPDNEMSLSKLLSSNIAAQFITEVILTPTDIEEVNATLRPQFVDAIFDLTFKYDVLEDHHLINKTPFFSRTLKSLIQGNDFKWEREAKKLVAVENVSIPHIGVTFTEKIAEALSPEDVTKNWVSGQGSFVVLAVLEALDVLGSSHAKSLRKTLKKLKEFMKNDIENKGAQLLVNAL
ncbi:ARM repeat-containing protein [Metschnikowia bicuspidata]|uniref:ARM repeat-containing protein n=1 Tax=Metschnikowia bicuspidata TaxID=27322 RepID=A0A4P9ZH53_9ASCO|nr:ARM repeat-containing protein [Metschnikowia bicuspidata]